MNPFIHIVILLASGLAGGILAGMFGIGGGVIYVLVYNTFLERLLGGAVPGNIIVQLTILNAACSILVAALTGSFRQYRRGSFYAGPVFALGLAGAAASFATTRFISGWESYDQTSFLLVFTLALIPLVLRFIPRRRQVKPADLPLSAFSVTGIFAGIGSALSGLGGGFISNPLLHGFLRYPLKKTFSVSLGSMVFTSAGIIAYHFARSEGAFSGLPIPHFHGIAYALLLPVIAGVLAGTPLGIRLQHRIPARSLGWMFFILALILITRNMAVIL